MQELHWLESHIGSLEQAQALANDFTWRLSIVWQDRSWHVLNGKVRIFSSADRESVDAFIYGLGLAYAIIPETLRKKLQHDLLINRLDDYDAT